MTPNTDMLTARAILHVDMDAFYASIEQHDDPELVGKPVLVGGTGSRGVVAAASYEARTFRVHSAMPMREALRRCPDAVCVRPRFGRYREASKTIFAIFREFTPLVEGLSLDEAFLDVSRSQDLFGGLEATARSIKARIRESTGLAASVGGGPNKLVAKIASDFGKPDGLHLVGASEVNEFLDPLPASRISGIGPKTAKRLETVGIHLCRDLRSAPDGVLESIFGRYGELMRRRASGIDHRPVTPVSEVKSISAEETFDQDLADPSLMQSELLRLTDRTAARLRSRGLIAGRVAVKIRRADFSTFTRQRQLAPAADDARTIYGLASFLLAEWLAANPGARVRLLGVGVSELTETRQLGLALGDRESSVLDHTVDEIRERFGDTSLRPARTLDR